MSTLGDIRAALAGVIRAAVPSVNVYAYAVDTFVAPAVIVFRPDQVDYREAFDTTSKRYVLPVQIRVQRIVPEAADDQLDELIDEVVAALLADPTLGERVDSCDVILTDSFGTVTADDGIEYLACNVNVEVLV